MDRETLKKFFDAVIADNFLKDTEIAKNQILLWSAFKRNARILDDDNNLSELDSPILEI